MLGKLLRNQYHTVIRTLIICNLIIWAFSFIAEIKNQHTLESIKDKQEQLVSRESEITEQALIKLLKISVYGKKALGSYQ